MPEAFQTALATPGLFWLMLAIGAAGIVRGFTGFGTALIFVPVANIFLEAKVVIAVITLTGIVSSAALLPRALRQGDRADVGLLVLAAMVSVPVGLWVLEQLDTLTVRWIVTGVAAGALIALVSGWRYSRVISRPSLIGIGALAGLIGGLTGLTGPVVILFYLAGQATAQVVRANTILFLAALDVVIVGNLLWLNSITWELVFVALVLAVPYFTTTMIGQALFDPGRERIYRVAAYGVIGLAVISGLPIWTQGG